jgi:hypothetical protein
MENKYDTPDVGSAIKTVKADDNYYFKVIIRPAELENCKVYKEYYNLSLKTLKTPSNQVTHIVLDSLYYSKGISDQFAEVNINLSKTKLLKGPKDKDGNIQLTVALSNKTKEREFQIGDFKVYFTKPAGSEITKEDYVGSGRNLLKQKDKQNHQKINRDFCGSCYVDHNDKLPHKTVLSISLRAEQIKQVAKGPVVYVNMIAFKNEPEKLAAYVSSTKEDRSALYTLKIETEKFLQLPVNEKGYTKIAGYFDDKLDKNYNINLVQATTAEQRENKITPIKIGEGADREHMTWQKESVQQKTTENIVEAVKEKVSEKEKIKKQSKIPDVEAIKEPKQKSGKNKTKGI